jgi:hypothetical protein
MCIEILQIKGREVAWMWTNETEERASKLDETGEAFKTGRVRRRLIDFERVR